MTSRFKISVVNALAEIKDFVRVCKKDETFAGFNVVVCKRGRDSLLLGKCNDSLMARYILKIPLDVADPLQRPLVYNAIHEAMYGKSMTAEEMENEMVCKAEPYIDEPKDNQEDIFKKTVENMMSKDKIH